MICDPMYMINLNYKSHSTTLPENLKKIQKAGLLQTSNSKESRSFCLALSSQHPSMLPPTHTHSIHYCTPHPPTCVLCQKDSLGLHLWYHNCIYTATHSIFFHSLYFISESKVQSKHHLSRATYPNQNVSTILTPCCC